MMWLLYLLLGLLGLVILLLLIAVIHTLTIGRSTRSAAKPAITFTEAERDKYVSDLSRMIQCETISLRGATDLSKFDDFHAVLAQLFPLIHEKLEKTEIDGSLLYRWPGQSHDHAVLLMSHQDVVEATGEWKYPPFSGQIAEGRIWGRGTMDTKGSLCAILEAVEELLREGFAPSCDVYVASSCNEEIMGDGAPKTAKHLQEQGVKLDLVLDEGGAIVHAPMPGLTGHYAMLGILEKGYADVRFVARAEGGHSSTPPKNTPIARLAAFVNHMEKHSPFKKKFTPPVRRMFRSMAADMSFPFRLLFGNLWLFEPLLKIVLPKVSGQAGAMLATTCAFTMMQGSASPNVIPAEASVTANLRFMIHQPMAESMEILRREAQKYGIDVELLEGHDCSPVVDMENPNYRFVEACVHECFPDAGVAPYIMLGGTDARHYAPHCPCAVRFAPLVISGQQMSSVHARDENVDVDAVAKAVKFYRYVLENHARIEK